MATFQFADDGLTPNNETLRLVLYRGVFVEADRDLPRLWEEAFMRHGWGDCWRNGIYDFDHFHSQAHEVLGIAKGQAVVLFGGAAGRALDLGTGDAVILPAGTGHRCLDASADLIVVGAYPAGATYDLCRPSTDVRARERIRRVPLPACDPALGPGGPLLTIWHGPDSGTASRRE